MAEATAHGPAVAVGDRAPDFTLPRQGGGTFHLGDLLGKRTVVLYFYPRDDTSGCTAEACGFRDQGPAFGGAGAEIVGVSGDSVASHDRFASKYDLPFTLVSDGEGVARRLYGVGPGGLPNRTTFVIDAQGVVRHVLHSLDEAADHVARALAALGLSPG